MANPTICVYCASSEASDPWYRDAAADLGRQLVARAYRIVYGGGGVGSMGALARAALDAGGHVTGIIPQFMVEREWAFKLVSELVVVDDMHQRKRAMLDRADAFVALPGGCGTFEELLEAITWQRLDLIDKPIVIANLRGFYDPCLAMLERSIDERFMTPDMRRAWRVAETIDGVVDRLGEVFGRR